MKAYLVILSLFYLFLVVKANDSECQSTPLKNEAKKLLGILGFSDSCTSTSLELCDHNCQVDFPGLFSELQTSGREAVTNIQKMLENLDSLSNCLKKTEYDEITTVKAKNCQELNASGVQTIFPFDCCPEKSVKVLCNQDSSGGGWTVIQRRENLPIRENFYRNWTEYAHGFGNLTGEFWLGLDNIHELTTQTPMMLRIEMENGEGVSKFAEYRNFLVGDSESKYKLIVSGYNAGDAGDSFSANDHKFSTKDEDNDIHKPANCAVLYKGAWWYSACHSSNLNGHPYVGKTQSYADGIVWEKFMGYHYSLSKVEMMIRPSA